MEAAYSQRTEVPPTFSYAPGSPACLSILPPTRLAWIPNIGGATAALLIALFSALPVHGAVRFDMFPGYDGLIPQGSWFPITFEVQNDGEAFIGTVEVTSGQINAGLERSMKVELPSGTTKRFTIPVFSGVTWNPQWSARLLDERRRVRAEADGGNIRRFNAALLPIAAAVSRHLPVLPETKTRQENLKPVFGRMQPAVFPDNPLTLEGLDALYLSSERALELKPAQVSALLTWLNNGGHLIVSIEQPNHLVGPGAWLGQLIPGRVSGLTTLNAPDSLQQWVTGRQRRDGANYDFSATASSSGSTTINPFARLEPDPGLNSTPLQVAQVQGTTGTVLVGSEQQPLVVITRRGLGQLTMLTFAPELEPFRSWKNSPYFWAKMVDLPPELLVMDWPNRQTGRQLDSIFGAMIDSRQIRKLPVGWLLLLLVAYLVVIGPLDQYWLKKLNRQMLTWLTFPAYVAFFSLLIYFIGYKLRAGETEWTELHIVDVSPHRDEAIFRGRTYGSIYSPINERYRFVSEAPFATWRGEFTGNYGAQESSRGGRVEQQPQGFAAEIPVPVWTSQLFLSDWCQQGPPPVTVTVNTREIQVVNSLNRPLTAAKLILLGQILDLGEVPAGETRTYRRGDIPNMELDSFVSSHVSNFGMAANARQQVFSGNELGRIDDWTNTVLAASFIERSGRWANTVDGRRISNYETFSTLRGFDLSHCINAEQAVFIAWAPGYSLIKPLNRFSARRSHRDTVLRVVAQIER
jgi:hypothetical protein